MSDRKSNHGLITYSKQGDYYLPNLTLPPQHELNIGLYGRKRKEFLKNYHRGKYYNLLTSVKLVEHLNDIDLRAMEMEERLINEFVEKEGITEQLKGDDMMLWVRKMNNIRNRVREIVFEEVVYKYGVEMIGNM